MTSSSSLRPVRVRGAIKLGQFLKLAGLVEDGGQARIAVQCGDVTTMEIGRASCRERV